MHRDALEKLSLWKADKNRKPLLLSGAPQVGKTWLMKEFAKQNYSSWVYLNFGTDLETVGSLFSGSLETERLLNVLSLKSGHKIVPGKTLLILDEIQECPRALQSLKYFCEELPQLDVVAAASVLGLFKKEKASFPVGKVNFLPVFPLTFVEFLRASGKGAWADVLESRDWELLKVCHAGLLDLLRLYFFVGGMPEAAADFLANGDFERVREIQQTIHRNYILDFDKNAPERVSPRMRKIWDSIPEQLAKDNRRFVFKELGKGARSSEYEFALQWLKAMHAILPLRRTSEPSFPLVRYSTGNWCKLYAPDIGLLCSMLKVPLETFASCEEVFGLFNGVLAKQFAFQELAAASKDALPLNYWQSAGKAEIDFVAQISNQIIPFEIAPKPNSKAKSLKVFMEKYQSPVAVRFSLGDCKTQDKLLEIPLYGACVAQKEVTAFLEKKRNSD